MKKLNLPEYQFKFRCVGNKKYIFDEIRKKYVTVTPEEWVRQNFIKYMVTELKYPAALISIEREITLNTLSKRCDAVIFSRQGNPIIIAEFKAPEVLLNQAVFDQIVRYNMALNVKFLIISNGIKHFCCKLAFENNQYQFLSGIPEYNSLTQ